MYITRYQINKIKKKLLKFLNNIERNKKKTKFYKLAATICRSNSIKININKNILNNIYFITDNINLHWAETDGQNIYLNNIKNYNYDLLYYTIWHELIHGMILRKDNSELSEYLEHKFMLQFNKQLI